MNKNDKLPNEYRYENYCGEECVIFKTSGKHKYEVIVDKFAWESYLKYCSWTATVNKNGRISTKTSINKQSVNIWRVIVSHEFSELDYWGATVDHINNNTLDNRKSNLRLYNSAILNSTNVSTKRSDKDMQYIYRNSTGYKVHYNVGGETYYEQFGLAEYQTLENALSEAKKYRDEEVLKQREEIISQLIKKNRDIEFERGLKDKLCANEKGEILEILKKYGVI